MNVDNPNWPPRLTMDSRGAAALYLLRFPATADDLEVLEKLLATVYEQGAKDANAPIEIDEQGVARRGQS